MLSKENISKLIELNIVSTEDIESMDESQIIELIVNKLVYYEDLITPGVLSVANRYKKLATDKIAYKSHITGKRCLELYEKWHSYTAVAEYLGVSVATVRRRILDLKGE